MTTSAWTEFLAGLEPQKVVLYRFSDTYSAPVRLLKNLGITGSSGVLWLGCLLSDESEEHHVWSDAMEPYEIEVEGADWLETTQLKSYADAVKRTQDPGDRALEHFVGGLAVEGCEVWKLFHKEWFHNPNSISRTEIVEELGDVLWYVTAICNLEGLTLQEVMEKNVEKLKLRYPNGFVKASMK